VFGRARQQVQLQAEASKKSMDDCLELESDPAMVAVARQFVRERLASWEAGEHLDPAVLVASELVTNAILHARTALSLRVELRDSSPPGSSAVRIEVFDQNPRLPALSPMLPEATSGRGLALIAMIATSWGMENRSDGKVVWAEIGGRLEELDLPEDCVDLSGVESVKAAFEAIDAGRPDEPAPDGDQDQANAG
jgi:anti-sigma regulatory factor (Ser/Thr protein kinase)